MNTEGVSSTLEQISENLVLAESSDLQALSNLHSMFETVKNWDSDNLEHLVVSAVEAIIELIECKRFQPQ